MNKNIFIFCCILGHFLIGLSAADFLLLLGELIWWINLRQNDQPRIGELIAY